jgi:hypothetical protein
MPEFSEVSALQQTGQLLLILLSPTIRMGPQYACPAGASEATYMEESLCCLRADIMGWGVLYPVDAVNSELPLVYEAATPMVECVDC